MDDKKAIVYFFVLHIVYYTHLVVHCCFSFIHQLRANGMVLWNSWRQMDDSMDCRLPIFKGKEMGFYPKHRKSLCNRFSNTCSILPCRFFSLGRKRTLFHCITCVCCYIYDFPLLSSGQKNWHMLILVDGLAVLPDYSD